MAALAPTAGNNGSIIPSASDLFMVLPRLGSQIAGVFGFGQDGSSTTNVTGNASRLATMLDDAFKKSSGIGRKIYSGAAAEGQANVPHQASFWRSMTKVSNMEGMLSYVASRWSVSTVVIALILKRAHVFASSRESVSLNWKSRLLLRFVPLVLLLYQILQNTRTLSCQTGYRLPVLKYNGTEEVLNRSWVKKPGTTHWLAASALFWESVEDSCQAARMIPKAGEANDWYGSASLLWPVYATLATSQFAETISSALRGRQPMPETGMTLFEHSLAFAEAEMIIRTSAGIGSFGTHTSSSPTSKSDSGKPTPKKPAASATKVPTVTYTRAMLLSRLNVPPEVLLVSLTSSCSHVASHILGVLGWQDRYRLANTGLWGTIFMSMFITSFVKFAQPIKLEDMHAIRYPTVAIIGFIPHILVFLGIMVCALVYVAAIASCLISSPPNWRHLSLWERLRLVHANMSASNALSNIHISRSEDFYSCLIKVGYQVVSAASEAVYFNEGVQVTLTPSTWLERTRLLESTSSARSALTQVPLELQEGFAGGEGFGLIDEAPQCGPDGRPLASGFARERKTMKTVNRAGVAVRREEGVGVDQRSGRWSMSWRLVEATFRLISYCHARILIGAVEMIGRKPPKWLARWGNLHTGSKAIDSWGTSADTDDQQQMLSDAGWLVIPQERSVDVEAEARRRLQLGGSATDAAILDRNLYDWFKRGGWWGDTDTSGDYAPTNTTDDDDDNDDDTTSIISEATAWESDSSLPSSGTCTPTRDRPSPLRTLRRRRGPRPTRLDGSGARRSLLSETDTDTENDLPAHFATLATLLAPTTVAQKQEARMLSVRLRQNSEDDRLVSSPSRPMTRSQYNATILRDRTALLHPSSSAAIAARRSAALISAEDEELLLSQLLVDRRRSSYNTTTDLADTVAPASGSDWASGGAGLGSGGPQCAVCRSAPRTVLVWPCRCLSLCDECRISLAVNGFGSCVCCRRDVMAFSRLFVP